MSKFKFILEAGLLVRRMARSRLLSLKRTVLFEEDEANVKIEEVKNLLGSEFYVVVTNISDEMTQRLSNWYNENKKRAEK